MTNPRAPSPVLPPLISGAAMRAIVDDRARLQRMLDFEAALVRAEAAVGIVPASAVDPILAACRAERYDLAALGEAIAAAGNLVAPFLKMITAEVAKLDAQAASYLNWGADGQDIVDTALVLELRAAIDALTVDLNRAIEAFIALAGRQRRTASMARASLRHALPMPFGLKVAGYAAALGRARERLRRLRKDALMLQFGGTAGTLAALGDQGLNVTERLAALLDLPAPEAPSHSQRDRLTEVACALGILAGTCGKVGRDLALLMQNEIAEVYDPADAAGRASDAATPKGLTPAAAADMAAAAGGIAPALVATILSGMMQEHERSASAGQTEWATFPALLLVTSGALRAVADLAQGIEVDADRMRANVDLTHGLIMAEAIVFALAGKIAPQEARKIVEAATRKAVAERRSLQNVLGEDARVSAHLSGPTLGRLFDPMSYQGTAQTFIDRLIGSLRSGTGKRL
jgi:3-carboxy-cis,cis-muconate cycloisomerase